MQSAILKYQQQPGIASKIYIYILRQGRPLGKQQNVTASVWQSIVNIIHPYVEKKKKKSVS